MQTLATSATRAKAVRIITATVKSPDFLIVQEHGMALTYSMMCISANRQPHRLAHPAQHLGQCIDSELGRLLVHHIGHAWP